VLPFEDFSEQKAGFADGVRQEIINRLTKVHDPKGQPTASPRTASVVDG
jgi:hypothetical protein